MIPEAVRVTLAGEDLGVWDINALDLHDSFLLKAATGLDLLPIYEGMGSMNPASWRAVIWWLKRKADPNIQPDAINFKWGDLEMAEVVGEDPPPSAETSGDGTSANAETSGSGSSAAGSDSAPSK